MTLRSEVRPKALLLVVIGIALVGTSLVWSADAARYSAEVESTGVSASEFGSLSDRAQNVTLAAHNASTNASEPDRITVPRNELPPPYSQGPQAGISEWFEPLGTPFSGPGDLYFVRYETQLLCINVQKDAGTASLSVPECLTNTDIDGDWYYSPVQSLPNDIRAGAQQAINDSNKTGPIRGELPAGFTTVPDAAQYGEGIYLVRQGTEFYGLTITYPDGNGWFLRFLMLLVGGTLAYAGVAWQRPEFLISVRTVATAKGALLFVGLLVGSFRVMRWVSIPLATWTTGAAGCYSYGCVVAFPLAIAYNFILAFIAFEVVLSAWKRLPSSLTLRE